MTFVHSEGFLHPVTMARSVYTAVAYAHHCCGVPVSNVLLYSQVPPIGAVFAQSPTFTHTGLQSMGGMAATLALPLLQQAPPPSVQIRARAM